MGSQAASEEPLKWLGRPDSWVVRPGKKFEGLGRRVVEYPKRLRDC